MRKILITGSRGFNRTDLVWNTLRSYGDSITLIHGGASGADSLAQDYADDKGIKTEIVRPIYPSKKEYYLHRNAEMVGMCDEVVAFWDGKSRGTLFTILYAKKRFKPCKIINLKKVE